MGTSWRSSLRTAAVCAAFLGAGPAATAHTRPVSVGTTLTALSGPDSVPLRLDSSYAINSCAPSDGPAVTLYLGGSVTGSGLTQRIEPPYVEISIWQPWSSLGGAMFVLEHYHGNGFAAYCPTEKNCEHLDYARVSFDAAIEDHLRGVAELTVRGRQINAPFTARRVDIRMMCG